MSFLKQMPHWLLADIILLILALFFKFAMRGYGYIAFALIYAAALVTLLPLRARRAVEGRRDRHDRGAHVFLRRRGTYHRQRAHGQERR